MITGVFTHSYPSTMLSSDMGHTMFVALQDVLARFHRMRGRPVLWLPGTDHAGIATQLQVEKLLISEGTTREEVGREKFLKRVWEYKAEQGGFITTQLRSLGASADWSRERFTMDPDLSQAVVEAFCRLHEKGLVYRGEYMVNWAPMLKTAVSDLEVEYSEEQGKLYYFKYMVQGSEGMSIISQISLDYSYFVGKFSSHSSIALIGFQNTFLLQQRARKRF
jgi:valyl-tRNA synthetase